MTLRPWSFVTARGWDAGTSSCSVADATGIANMHPEIRSVHAGAVFIPRSDPYGAILGSRRATAIALWLHVVSGCFAHGIRRRVRWRIAVDERVTAVTADPGVPIVKRVPLRK